MEVGRGQRQFDLSLLKSSKVNFVVGQDTFKIFKAKEIIQVSIYIGIKLRAIEHKCWDRDSFRAFFLSVLLGRQCQLNKHLWVP